LSQGIKGEIVQRKIWIFSVVFIFFLTFFLVSPGWAQQKGNKPVNSPQEVQGTIRVSGAWALYPMMVTWGEEFRKIHPKVRIDISAGGAGKGAADALAGLVDLGMVSRQINPEEVKQGAFYIPVVKDAVFPTINDANPVLGKGLAQKGAKKQTFIDLWIAAKDLKWGEVAGTNSKDPVRVYTRSDSCGAAETWAQYLGNKKQEDLQGVGVYGDPGLAEAVRKDILGVGYNNLNYVYDFKTGLPPKGISVFPIDVNENGKVDPDEDLRTKAKALQAIASGRYPSPPARDLYLMTQNAFKGVTKSFVVWILTDGQKYVDENGYIRLAKLQITQSLKKLGD
jgi:phosphate transport system substrate-binding protein